MIEHVIGEIRQQTSLFRGKKVFTTRVNQLISPVSFVYSMQFTWCDFAPWKMKWWISLFQFKITKTLFNNLESKRFNTHYICTHSLWRCKLKGGTDLKNNAICCFCAWAVWSFFSLSNSLAFSVCSTSHVKASSHISLHCLKVQFFSNITGKRRNK